MAKEEHDREDLLKEATGYIRRVELKLPDVKELIFFGFRECGAASVYFGQDNVLQFNADRELRRAYWQGRLLASYRRSMHWLDRSEGNIRLTRTALSDAETTDFFDASKCWLEQLSKRLNDRLFSVVGEVPAGTDVASEALDWLMENNNEIHLAIHPGLARKK